jgi:putative ABC transport system substrate-binding protein
MKRREFIVGLGGAAAWPLAARAQQGANPVIGFLFPGSLATMRESAVAFQRGLADLGFADGWNVAIEYRWADGQNDRLPALALELVRRDVAVVVTPSTPATVAAKAASQTIPIVFQVGVDPREFGLVASLSRPGGKLTGVAELNVEVAAKCLEALHELVPAAALIVVLVNPANQELTQELQAAARVLGVGLLVLNAGSQSEIEIAFETLVRQRAGALVVSADPYFQGQRDQLALLAARAMPFRAFISIACLSKPAV